MKQDQHIHLLLRYLLPIYLLVLVLLTLFRGAFVYHFYEDFLLLYQESNELYPILLKAFVKGFRYDAIVVSYVMILPLIALIVLWVFNLPTKLYFILSKIYIIVAFALVFALSCMDFPYFKYFWTHPTVSIFNWAGFGGTFGMLFQESSYYPYYALLLSVVLILSLASYLLGRWALREERTSMLLGHKLMQIGVFLTTLIICLIGTRGQLSTQPLGVNAAFFTDHKLISDMCMTPVYYFMSYINDYEVDFNELMDESEAVSFTQKQLNSSPNSSFKNPLTRQIEADSTKQAHTYNVILVFMESLSSKLLHQKVGGEKLTPFLDSLTENSYYFKNFYSSGVHTNLGVASTLISHPSRFSTHMMGRQPYNYKGLATTLKSKGYSTSFFMPNEEVYDNMGIFLKANGIDTIFSDNHYKKEDKANNFGVPDDFLFNFSIQEINKFAKQPFFASILTVSNHPPYVVPKEHRSISEQDDVAILSFVDTSVASFMRQASEQEWYDNTIFVFLGDHGKIVSNQIYNMPLSNNHIPLIIYSPTFEDMGQSFSQFGGQIDVFPTIMGLLNQSYTNNTLGIDLFNEERPYMFFSSDTHLGCIDDKFFYTFNPKDGSEALYDVTEQNGVNIITQFREVADSMKKYALCMLTTANALDESGLVEVY